MQLYREPIQVSFEKYDTDEFVSWSRNDPRVVERILGVTGDLGRSSNVYRNQLGSRMSRARLTADGGGYNYAEVKLAQRLIDDGWPAAGIVYENYALSRVALSSRRGLKAKGCELVREALTPEFLNAFDEMVERHPTYFGSMKVPKEARVDLFALDAERHRAGIWEVKRYNPRTAGTEPIGTHQRAVLAFASHLVHVLGARAVTRVVREFHVGLVVFVPASLDQFREDRVVAATDRYCDIQPWAMEAPVR
jgi:hypothetical protein